MSTILLEKVRSEVLSEDIYFSPPLIVPERYGHPDASDLTIGQALGHAILQKGLDESVVHNAEVFDAELEGYAKAGDIGKYRETIGNAFYAQGIVAYVVEPVPLAPAFSDAALHLAAA
jgi:hypothetical protein